MNTVPEPFELVDTIRSTFEKEENEAGHQNNVIDIGEIEEMEEYEQTIPSLSDEETGEDDKSEVDYPEKDFVSGEYNEELTEVSPPSAQVPDDTSRDQAVSKPADIETASRFQPITHAIVCTSEGLESARKFGQDIEADPTTVIIVTCNVKEDFDEVLEDCNFQTIYLIVDSKLCDVMLNKRRIHDSIDELFEKLVETSKVYLVRSLPEEENIRYDRLKTQLPDGVSEIKEVLISNETTQTLNQALPQELGTTSMNVMRSEDLSDVQQNVMVGSHCQMNIHKSDHQLVVMKQDGSHNIVNVQIVPGATVSKVTVVITTDPDNPELEKRLLSGVCEDQNFINICLQHYDGTIIKLRHGSIIIELDVQQGKTIGFDYLKNVLETIFQGDVARLIPNDSEFKVAVDVQNVFPLSKLKEYFSGYSASEEDLHKNCISEEQYEAVKQELNDAQREKKEAQRELKDAQREKKEAQRELKEVQRELIEVQGELEHCRMTIKRSLTSKHPSVSVVLRDITEEKTDVIVNSTNSSLVLSDGELSNDILKAAGGIIQDQCRSNYSSKIKIEFVAVTDGGNLACKEIYHITLSDRWMSQQSETEESLRRVLRKCLELADKSGHESISIPALGTGRLKYDPEVVAQIMYDTIRSFRPLSLKEVHFVIHPKFPNIRKMFIDEEEKVKVLERSKSVPSKLSYGIPPLTSTGKLNLTWQKGDISALKVDVVVNSTDKTLHLTSGPVSHAVLKAAGYEVQEECKSRYSDGITTGNIAYTSGGKLCNFIFHTTLWDWTDSLTLEKPFKQLIKRILEEADDRRQRSIAFPMLGTGLLKYPPKTVAMWLKEAVDDFEVDSKTSLQSVYVVVHTADVNSIEALRSMGMLKV